MWYGLDISGSSGDHDQQIFVNPIMPWHNLETSRSTCTTISNSAPLPYLPVYLLTYFCNLDLLITHHSDPGSWTFVSEFGLVLLLNSVLVGHPAPRSMSLAWCHGPVSFNP